MAQAPLIRLCKSEVSGKSEHAKSMADSRDSVALSIKLEVEQPDEELDTAAAAVGAGSAFKSELLDCSVAILSEANNQQQQMFCECESCGTPFSDPNHLEQHVLSGDCPSSVLVVPGPPEVSASVQADEDEDDDDYNEDYDEDYEEEDDEGNGGGAGKVCLVCSKSFATRANLVRHMIAHTDQRSLECSVCHKMFSQASYLKQHMLIHLGERPYTCRECGRTFTQSSTLKTHMFTHNWRNNPHQCPTCGKTFTRPCRLTTHLLVHKREQLQAARLPSAAAAAASSSYSSTLTPSTRSRRRIPANPWSGSSSSRLSGGFPLSSEPPKNSPALPQIRPRPPPRLLPKPPPPPMPPKPAPMPSLSQQILILQTQHQQQQQQQQQQLVAPALQPSPRPTIRLTLPAKSETKDVCFDD